METIYFNGTPCHTYGQIPAVGTKAPAFTLVTPELTEVRPSDFQGKKMVLNVFPSLDTPVCAASVRRFNEEAGKMPDTVVLCVSMDLPFAAGRFCTAEGLKNVIPASAFRAPMFGEHYGLQMIDGPLSGLLARAVIVLDFDRYISYAQLVEDITSEPDYEAVLDVLRRK